MEAVNKGTAAVGVRGNNAVVIAVEKRTVGKLQDQRSTSKIALLDDHVTVAFAGLALRCMRMCRAVMLCRARCRCTRAD